MTKKQNTPMQKHTDHDHLTALLNYLGDPKSHNREMVAARL